MSGKKLPPPKGAAEVMDAAGQVDEASRVRRLSDRYSEPGAALDWSRSGGRVVSAVPTATEPTATPAPASTPPAAPPRRPTRERRPEPEGMTRKTYYLPVDAADALDQAVKHVQKAVGGRVDKHVVLGALIAAGAADKDRVASAIRAALLRDLGA